jgi:tetratricopeptide (TPR) repeat protein
MGRQPGKLLPVHCAALIGLVTGCTSPGQPGPVATGENPAKFVSRVLQEKPPDANEQAQEYGRDGQKLIHDGKWREALETYNAAIKIDSANPEWWYQAGRCQEKVGRLDLAEQSYRTALNLRADHAPSRHSLVMLMANSGHREEASKMVEGWLASNPRSSAAFAEDGWLYLQNGDLPRAQARLQQALAIDPNEPMALVQLGEVYEKMNRPDRALVLYERALVVRPDQPPVKEKVQRLKATGVGVPKPD